MKHILYFILIFLFSCSIKTANNNTSRIFDEKKIDYDFTVSGYVNNKLFIKKIYKDSLCIYSCSYEKSNIINPYVTQKYLYQNRKLDSILFINGSAEVEKDFYTLYDYNFRFEKEVTFFINELEKYNIKIPYQFRGVLGLELYQMSMFIGYYELRGKHKVEMFDTLIGRTRKIKLNYIDTTDISFQAEKLQLGSKFQPENNMLLQYSVDIASNFPISDEIKFTNWKIQRKYRFYQDKKGNYFVFIKYV